jgi:hypothetical protein
MFNGKTTGWKFSFEGQLWALTDPKPDSRSPCQLFQWFSQQKHAYIVQTTCLTEDWWKEWRKECSAGLFIIKCFAEKEAKALRLVIIASILFILFDLFS